MDEKKSLIFCLFIIRYRWTNYNKNEYDIVVILHSQGGRILGSSHAYVSFLLWFFFCHIFTKRVTLAIATM
jgi:hypothetical protein